MYRHELAIILIILVFATVGTVLVARAPLAGPEISYPAQYAQIVYVEPGFDFSAIPEGSTIVVLPPRESES